MNAVTPPRPGPPPVLYAEDLARIRGTSVRAAQRQLVRLEREHGPTVVGSEARAGGRRRWTTVAALERTLPILDSDSHRDAMIELNRKQTEQAEEIRALRAELRKTDDHVERLAREVHRLSLALAAGTKLRTRGSA